MTMKGRMLVVVLISAVALTMVGCHPDLRTEVARLETENSNLKQEVSRLSGRLEGCQAQLSDKDARIQQLQLSNDTKDRQLALANRKIEELAGKTTTVVQGGTITKAQADMLKRIASEFPDQLEYDEAANIVRIKEAINFPSGRATISGKSKQAITEVGKIFSGFDNVAFRVTGHTDNDPIKKSAKINKDNMDLSLKRAHAVWDVLNAAGVDKDKMYCAGFGMIRPMAGTVDKQSTADKKVNRRVEILMVPATLMK